MGGQKEQVTRADDPNDPSECCSSGCIDFSTLPSPVSSPPALCAHPLPPDFCALLLSASTLHP